MKFISYLLIALSFCFVCESAMQREKKFLRRNRGAPVGSNYKSHDIKAMLEVAETEEEKALILGNWMQELIGRAHKAQQDLAARKMKAGDRFDRYMNSIAAEIKKASIALRKLDPVAYKELADTYHTHAVSITRSISDLRAVQ